MTSKLLPVGRSSAFFVCFALTGAAAFAQVGGPATAPGTDTPGPLVPPPGAPGGTAPGAPGATAPASQIDPAATALLNKTATRYKTLKSFQATMVMQEGEGAAQKELIQYLPVGSLKLTALDSTGKPVLTQYFVNGKAIVLQKVNGAWEYISQNLPPLKPGQTARTRLADLNIGGGGYFPNLLAGRAPFQNGRTTPESLTLGEPTTMNGVAVDSVVAKMDLRMGESQVQALITFYIGHDDPLLYGIQTELNVPGQKNVKLRQTFQDIKADIALPAATFTFAAPAGAKKVADFSQPQIKAKVGEMPLAFTGKDLSGKALSLDQYKGKVVLVDFWATWCGPCVAELPNVKAAYNKYHAKGFEVVGISLDQEQAELKKFIKEKNMPWRQVWDGYWSGPIATKFNVQAIPATMLIGKDGKVVALDARAEALEPAIVKALSKK